MSPELNKLRLSTLELLGRNPTLRYRDLPQYARDAVDLLI